MDSNDVDACGDRLAIKVEPSFIIKQDVLNDVLHTELI